VHDAARPFATPALAAEVVRAAAREGAALAAVPATDTVKRAAAGGRSVAETLDRRAVWLAQTPQAFRAAVLRRAFEAAGAAAAEATDECALVERLGHPVILVPGDPANVKLTTPDDLDAARARLEAPVAMGVGYDTHRFSAGRKLVLGGVEFEGDGLLGHSDADVCAHAIGDAILGAAGLGDIGRHFPDTDAQFKSADSMVLLAEATKRVRAAGFEIGNIDSTIIAQAPKMAPHIQAMRERLSFVLCVAVDQVNVKAKTAEKMGPVGEGLAIEARAVALLRVRA